MFVKSAFCIVVVLIALDGAMSYPNFVPTSSCQSLYPSHGSSPQNSPAPYSIGITVNCYTPGQAITVTLSGASTSTSYRGFMAAARLAGSSSTDADGSFSAGGDSDIRTVNCNGRTNSAVSHTNSRNKIVKSFQWTPAASLSQPVDIVATFVRTESVFWVGVTRRITKCQPTTTTSTATTTSTPISTPSSANSPQSSTTPHSTTISTSTTSATTTPATTTTTRSTAPSSSSVSPAGSSSSTSQPAEGEHHESNESSASSEDNSDGDDSSPDKK